MDIQPTGHVLTSWDKVLSQYALFKKNFVGIVKILHYKHQVSQTKWFGQQTVDVLNHVPAFSCQKHWLYQTMYPQPINCNSIPQKDTMIPYMGQAHHPLSNQILAIFFSTNVAAMLINSPYNKVCNGFSTLFYALHIRS